MLLPFLIKNEEKLNKFGAAFKRMIYLEVYTDGFMTIKNHEIRKKCEFCITIN